MAAEVAVRLAVRDALGSLSPRQRAVLVLRVYDDLSEAQVAEVLDCPVGTVKSTMSRAVAQVARGPAARRVPGTKGPVIGMDRPVA